MSDLHTAMAKAFPGSCGFFQIGKRHYATMEGDIVSVVREPRRLTGTRCGEGYVASEIDGKRRYHHAIICELAHGPRPSARHQVRHLNGDRLANGGLNLAWGTPIENNADKVRHGTVTSGERNPMAKLTREGVEKMRAMRTAGSSFKEIGQAFSVSTMTALRAVKGESWK